MTKIHTGALAIGFFYRDRSGELRHDHRDDGPCYDFYPEPGFDTNQHHRSDERDNSEEGEKCIICLEPMTRFQFTKTFICSHKYHKKCIDNWFRYESFCPACRTVISM